VTLTARKTTAPQAHVSYLAAAQVTGILANQATAACSICAAAKSIAWKLMQGQTILILGV
jgi:hypothetical protein